MKKHTFYTEISFLLGLLILSLGNALMVAGGFGVSTVIAPAYLLYSLLSRHFSFFTFGMAEYLFQGFLLTVTVLLLRRVRLSYLLSFLTALLYGALLDNAMTLLAGMGSSDFLRLIAYLLGIPICACGVSLLFHTYLPPAAYEMLGKEISEAKGIPLSQMKLGYDCASCALSIAMSFAFFGALEGIGIGTLLCAFINGPLIGLFNKFWERHFAFRDALPLRKYM